MFTEKETTLLKDLKTYEETCVEKYKKYSSQACAQPLKTLFQELGTKEQQHLQTIDQMITSGSAPAMGGSQSGQQQQQQQGQSSQKADYSSDQQGYQSDNYLCTDALSTEKHVSSVYDTSIFEFKDTTARNTLNHIQKEEQEHGQKIYDYMSCNGMYS